MRVNLEGALIGMNLAIPAMREGGAVVNLSSVAAFDGAPLNASYAAAKLALISLTTSAAVRCAGRSPVIRVNAVAPGMTRTPTLENTLRAIQKLPREADAGPAILEYAKAVPLRRPAEPRELANAILFLASEEASYVTGECLVVDGGVMASR
jgi:NAD(P)-dependent dehydrogenase (short-subunit alcohol dehydrogenase family)